MPHQQTRPLEVAVIGGGVAGVTIATQLLGHPDIRVTLIERSEGLVNGPPFCHLHAGGNLYREIDIGQCKQLLAESVDTLKLYPHCANVRPTVIAVPTRDPGEVAELLPKLRELQQHYQQLVDLDGRNQVLGNPADYYRLLSKEQMVELAKRTQPSRPKQLEDWLIPVAQQLDFNTVKWPLIVVQEYGLSLFRVAATAEARLSASPRCRMQLGQTASSITKQDQRWQIETDTGQTYQADYLVNACGYRVGELDDQLGVTAQRLVEFKAAYLAKWDNIEHWPELIFHGTRGTENGMAQFTPYANGVFQLHGMTNEITLFKDGVAKSSHRSAQPQLGIAFKSKLDHGWLAAEVEQRTHSAINFLAYFLPSFANATVGAKPMYGAQQVPGDDLTLRTAGVVFPQQDYARAEIVKANSAIVAARAIERHLLESKTIVPKTNGDAVYVDPRDIVDGATRLALVRGYPPELALPWPPASNSLPVADVSNHSNSSPQPCRSNKLSDAV